MVEEKEPSCASRGIMSPSGTVMPEAGREVTAPGGATYPPSETSEKTFMLVSTRPRGTQ